MQQPSLLALAFPCNQFLQPKQVHSFYNFKLRTLPRPSPHIFVCYGHHLLQIANRLKVLYEMNIYHSAESSIEILCLLSGLVGVNWESVYKVSFIPSLCDVFCVVQWENKALCYTHTQGKRERQYSGRQKFRFIHRNKKSEEENSNLACSWLDDTQSALISVFNMTPTCDWWLWVLL